MTTVPAVCAAFCLGCFDVVNCRWRRVYNTSATRSIGLSSTVDFDSAS